MIGRTLHHYAISAELGSGAMGRVYLATDTATSRRVALKFLGTTPTREARDRLAREAQAAARLSHPGIVPLYALEEHEGEPFLVQEFVEGESLARRLERGPLGTVESRRLARELADALAHAHRRGVFHRNLKPANVLVAADGSFRITDFGIARIEGVPTITDQGTLLGTLPYMAPERLRGHRGDARADLFSFGAILHEAVTGRRAFPGGSEAEVFYQVMNEDPAPGEVPPGAAPLVVLAARLMAKEPGQRPASADVVLGTLEGMGTGVGGAAAPSAVPGGVAAPVAAPAGRRRGSATWWIAAAGALAVVAAAVLAWRAVAPRFARPAPGVPPAIAVLLFDNVADPADSARLGAVTGNLLVTSLAQFPEINVLGTQRVLEAMHRLGHEGSLDRATSFAVAREVHASRIVTGTILREEPGIVMTAEVADVRSGRLLQAVRVEGSPGEDVFQVVDDLSARLLPRIVPGLESRRLQPVAERGSADLEANRRYVEGLRNLARADLRAAATSFGRALERDPEFPQARFRLAIARWWGGEYTDAASLVEQAETEANRLSPREHEVLEGVRQLVHAQWNAAARQFEAARAGDPEDRLASYGLLEAYFHGGNDAGAEQVARQLLRTHPDFVLAGLHLVDALSYQHRYSEAESVATSLLARDPDAALLWVARGENAARWGRRAVVESVIAGAVRAKRARPIWPAVTLLRVNQDDLAAARGAIAWAQGDDPALNRDHELALEFWAAERRGRFTEALAVAKRAWRNVSHIRDRGRASFPIADGVDEAIAASPARRAWVRSMADSVGSRFAAWIGDREFEEFGLVYGCLLTGRLDEAERRLDAMGNVADSSSYELPVYRYLRAALDVARGRAAEALPLLERCSGPTFPIYVEGDRRVLRARAFERLGRDREALDELERLRQVPVARPFQVVELENARGRLLERLGRRDEAREAYRRFLALWKDGDPNLPGVADAKAALARLEADGPAVSVRPQPPGRSLP